MTGVEPVGQSWRFRPDIEGLRAIAIVGVVLFHAGVRSLSGGFLGVDVFFVLSGFLITGILLAEVQAKRDISLPGFWARRVRRLLPAATLVSLVTLLLVALLDSPFTGQDRAKSAISFATYWSNLLFVRRGSDYFNHAVATDPYLHTWSLAVEEQYYLLFAPLCFLLIASIRGRDPATFRHRLFGWALGVSLISFAAALILTRLRPLISFYTLPSRAWEFGIGGMLAVPAAAGPRVTTRWDQWFAAGGVLAVVAAWFVVNDKMPHPGWPTLLPVLGTAALIHAGAGAGTHVGRLLEMPPMRWLGRLSYSWYLWHWPVTVYWRKLVPGNPIPLVVGMPVISLALAQLTYVTLEAPARQAVWLQRASRGLLAAPILALMTVVTALATLRLNDSRLRDPSNAFILEARSRGTAMFTDHCHLNPVEVKPKLCAYGNSASDTTLVLFGDSHAAQWFAAFELVALRRGWRLVPMTKSGCPSVTLRTWLPALGREYFECTQWRKNVFERLMARPPTVVVLSNTNWYAVVDSTGSDTLPSPPPSAIWRQGLRASLELLPQTSRILLLEDSPNPHFDIPECLFEHLGNVHRCAFPRDSAFALEVSRTTRGVAQQDARVTYLDLNEHICNVPMCPAAHGDTAFFSDADHLSVSFAQSLSPWLEPVLQAIVRGATH